MKQAGWCVSGVRAYCEREGIDFRRLVRTGIPVDEVKDRDCAYVRRMIEAAERENDK